MNQPNVTYKLTVPFKEIDLDYFSDTSLSTYAACIDVKSESQLCHIGAKSFTAILRVVQIEKLYRKQRLKQLGNYILSKLVCNKYFCISNEIDIEQYFC